MLSKKFDYLFKRFKPKAKTKYKCEQCDKEYVYFKPLKNHYKIVHDVEFMSIKDQIDRVRIDPIIRTEEKTKPNGTPKSSSSTAPLQSKPSRSYSIGHNFVCSKCINIKADNHLVIRKHIEKFHKGNQVTIHVQCGKCERTFTTLTACKQHQWDKHIKHDQVEFPGTCCEFGCMKKYADLGGLKVHHNRHVQQSMESGEQWKESIRESTNWNCQFGCLDKCETIEQLIEMHNKHGKTGNLNESASSKTQIVIENKLKTKSVPTKEDTTGAQQIIININQFNSPQHSVVPNSKAEFNIAKQNTVTIRPKTDKYSNNVPNRNRKIIRSYSLSKHCNPHNDVDYREQFGQLRRTKTVPPKLSTDTYCAK